VRGVAASRRSCSDGRGTAGRGAEGVARESPERGPPSAWRSSFRLGREGGRLENRGEAEKREKERRTTSIAVERTVARLISVERFCRKVPQLCGYLVT